MTPKAPGASSGTAPLAGVVVVELGSNVAAPFAGQIMGDLGAEVIKTEKGAGDGARMGGPPFWEGAAASFQPLNRGKKSVVCEMRDPAQLAALKALVRDRADVVLQNMRPGQVESLRLDGPTLVAQKPSLVYCNIGAFGASGPFKDRPGYDPLMQAFSGIMNVTGERGRPPVRVGPSIVDLGTGMWAVIGVLTALRRLESTGRGGIVDVSLFETAATWMSLLVANYLASGDEPPKQGSGAIGIVPYRAYATRDGDLVVAAANDAIFRLLAGVLGHPEWSDDPRFATNPQRVTNQALLYEMIEAEMLTRASAEWVTLLEAAGVPCAPVQNIATMLAHPQTAALRLLQDVPGTAMKFLGLPVSLDGERPPPRSRPPRLGEHTDDYLERAQPARRPRRASRRPRSIG
jgi:crotonobetainyl-CoA:carnitine CoA-transferase CaiB-like acyl-CoA transferase